MLNQSNQNAECSLLESIKKKIHKIKPHQEKLQNNIKICSFPPGITVLSPALTTIRLKIPLLHLSKEPYLEETILWDLQENYSDEQLFRNLFAIVVDLLEQRFQNVASLSAAQSIQIIESCIAQIKQHRKQSLHKHHRELIPLDTYLVSNDSMINITIEVGKIKETIQWDLENEYNNIDSFAFTFCYENKLDQEVQVIVGNQIREQIQRAFERKVRRVQKMEDQSELKQELKQRMLQFFEFPSYEHYQRVTEFPKSQDLISFFKKNLEFLPPDMQQLYGGRAAAKQIIDLSVDYEDTKKFEKELLNDDLDPLLIELLKNNKV